MESIEDLQFDGVYGKYTITLKDKKEVQLYRFSVLLCGTAFFIGLMQWILIGPGMAWIWLITMSIGLGLSLNWIHIYLRPLHKMLQFFWVAGFIGLIILSFYFGPKNLLSSLNNHSLFTLAIGPLFAALTGLGFKEFFCFRRPEAIGLTILVPCALLGHLSQLLKGEAVMTLLLISSFLLLTLALRKFGMDAGADVGDKSVFEYLDNN